MSRLNLVKHFAHPNVALATVTEKQPWGRWWGGAHPRVEVGKHDVQTMASEGQRTEPKPWRESRGGGQLFREKVDTRKGGWT